MTVELRAAQLIHQLAEKFADSKLPGDQELAKELSRIAAAQKAIATSGDQTPWKAD